MIIEDNEKHRYWRYFLLLEEDFDRALRYVEPVPAQDDVYSLEFARQLLSACAQFETVARSVCRDHVPGSTAKNINQFRDDLWKITPPIEPEPAVFYPRHLKIYPFRGWLPNTPPAWWTAYNKVKHDPAAQLESAQLQYVRDALAALGLLTALYVRKANIVHFPRVFDLSSCY